MKNSTHKYLISVVHGVPVDGGCANADIIVEFDSGRRFAATVFTIANIQQIMEAYETSGECAGGRYFWASDMIILRSLTLEEIEAAVADLIATGEFFKAVREI